MCESLSLSVFERDGSEPVERNGSWWHHRRYQGWLHGEGGGQAGSVSVRKPLRKKEKKKKEVADALIAPVRLLRLCGAPRGRSVWSYECEAAECLNSMHNQGINYHLEALKFKQDSLQPGQRLCECAWITSNAHDYSVMWLRLNQPHGTNRKWQSTNPRASNVILLVALRELWGAPKDLSPVESLWYFQNLATAIKKTNKKNRNSLCPVMSPAPSALLEKSLHSEKGQLRKWHPPQSG